MKRIAILSMLLTATLLCLSCEDDEHFDHYGNGYDMNVAFRHVDLTGATTLALAAESGSARVMTRGEGDNNGQPQFNYASPLYKVSADGTMVEVSYDVEVVTKSKDHETDETIETRDSLTTNLRLKIEYIYAISDKWLLLCNCCYDYPGYDELPDGNLKASVNRLLVDQNNINMNYMVRLSDGALFLLDQGPSTPSLCNPGMVHTQNDVQGVIEIIGRDIYYLDHNPSLARMEDRGNVLDVSYVLNSSFYIDFLLNTGSVLGVIPSFAQDGSRVQGRPSVIFPGGNEAVAIQGTAATDKDFDLMLVDNELYLSRNNGYTQEEIDYPLSRASFIVGETEYTPNLQTSEFDWQTNYSIYNVTVPEGSKITIKDSDGTVYKVCECDYFSIPDNVTVVCEIRKEQELSGYTEYVFPEGTYEFYFQLAEWGGMMQFAPEGWSSAREPDFQFGCDRYTRGDKAAFYKVVIEDGVPSLTEEPVLTYFGPTPHLTTHGQSYYDCRHNHFITGGVVSWFGEKGGRAILCRADLVNSTYNEVELPTHFPQNLNEFHDGVAYVADGNTGYYECSLSTVQETLVPIDLTALSQYRSSMTTDLSAPKYDNALGVLVMTAYLQDGTRLTVYVDVDGPDKAKARVFATQAHGAGVVISSLVRLN